MNHPDRIGVQAREITIMSKERGVYLGLGSNLGSREKNLVLSLDGIKAHPAMKLLKVSSIYETKPWGMENQPWFLNAVCEIETDLKPPDLLKEVKDMELALGRLPGGIRWGPRKIDLDILLYRDLIYHTRDLAIPHPHLTERLFVLVPLVEIAPEMAHPKTGIPFGKYLEQLKTLHPDDVCSLYTRKA